MQFNLTIALGNAAMSGPRDVASALEQVAIHLRSGGHDQGTIMDPNGNSVGKWSLLDVDEGEVDARRDDPATSKQRSPGPVDIPSLVNKMWAKWDDRSSDHDGYFTDDDVAIWIDKPRNVAAKVRATVIDRGQAVKIEGVTKENPNGQRVMCFRPIS